MSKSNNTYAVKDKVVYDYYHNYDKEKPKYETYMQRIVRFGYSKEEAILLKDNREKSKTLISEDWRVCTKCKIFKVWDLYHNSSRLSTWKCSQCIECRNEKKREYRKTIQWQIKDKNYKILKRADPEYRKKEYEKYKIWAQKNKEKRKEISLRYQKRKATFIKERKRELEKFYFSPWKKVSFWRIPGKIKEVKKRLGCLVTLENGMTIWIAKNRLRPYKLISETKKNFNSFV